MAFCDTFENAPTVLASTVRLKEKSSAHKKIGEGIYHISLLKCFQDLQIPSREGCVAAAEPCCEASKQKWNCCLIQGGGTKSPQDKTTYHVGKE
mmetsp:Transcript_48319/g.70618  ORF Transcript_48319/g.70618 Transcript_48319/m.70618 type:complete len:94 (-) Transcript_48319:446-727(-)